MICRQVGRLALETVLTRSGPDRLVGIVDRVLATKIPPPANRVRLLGTEIASGRSCLVLELPPRIKDRLLIVGKASFSRLVGAPSISEEFVEVHGSGYPGTCDQFRPVSCLARSSWTVNSAGRRLVGP
jgi:hypothetical protein